MYSDLYGLLLLNHQPDSPTYDMDEKSRTLRFQTFEEALGYLKSMKPAKCWRPNPNGNWGLVTAVRWAPLPDSEV